MQREEPTYENKMDNTHQKALTSDKTEKKFNKKGPCFYCKKDGHITSECRLLKRPMEADKWNNQRKTEYTQNLTAKEPESQGNERQLASMALRQLHNK